MLKKFIFTSLKKTFTILILLIGLHLSSFAQQKPSVSNGSSAKVTKYYPNPATNIINFDITKTSDNTLTLQLFNFMGRKVSESSVNSPKITFLLDGFYRGIYIYQLRDRNGKIVDSGKFQVVKN